jgi:hypothetical protein
MLHDDVLLAIFDFFCAEGYQRGKKGIEAWQSLVHVCRRWRRVVFGSPRHLNLQLVCTGKKPVKDTLDVWPALPLYIQCNDDDGVDNVIAVLEHSDRVRLIDISHVQRPYLENLSAAMQKSFPELTSLVLWERPYRTTVLPDSFLGQSAPRLQILELYRIPFPGLPKLLLSSTHLVTLVLWGIPPSGYISPEAIATALSTLTRLEKLSLEFESPPSHPDRAGQHLLQLTRSVFPALTSFVFNGVSEYLEDLVARFDAPKLNSLHVNFTDQIVFDAPQFIQFISRTPKSNSIEGALINFENGGAYVKLSSISSRINEFGELSVKFSSSKMDREVSSLARVCTSSLPPFSTVEDLYIDRFENIYWLDGSERVVSWLDLLRPFGSVKNLYLSEQFARNIVPALQELVGSRTTEVLPTLRNIFLEGLKPPGHIQAGIRRFVAVRQVTSHPVAVSCWVRNWDDDEEEDYEDDDDEDEYGGDENEDAYEDEDEYYEDEYDDDNL